MMINEEVCSANVAHVLLNGWPQFGTNYFIKLFDAIVNLNYLDEVKPSA